MEHFLSLLLEIGKSVVAGKVSLSVSHLDMESHSNGFNGAI